MHIKANFELAFVILISTLILVVGLYDGADKLSHLLIFALLYLVLLLSSYAKYKKDSVLTSEVYFSGVYVLFLASTYFTEISAASVFIVGTIMMSVATALLQLKNSFWAFLALQIGLFMSAQSLLWLSVFSLVSLASYIFSIYLKEGLGKNSRRLSRKLSEAEIERERLTSLVNSMKDGVIATDPKGSILLYNGASLDILDTNRSIENAEIHDVIKLHNEDNEDIDLIKEAEKNNGYLTSRDYRLVQGDDEFINLYVAVSPVRLGYREDSKMLGYIIVIRDITKEKSLEEERDEFISVVSHELRTPITIAEGNISNAQLMLENSKAHIEDEVNLAIDDAHKQVVFLADMINDLSTLSRADRGVLRVEPTKISIKDLIDSLVRDYNPDASAKGLKLEYEYEDDLVLYSSQLYVREVLQNFLTNAIKYTQEGFVKIAAKKSENGVRFEVIDSGIGVSKSDQKKIFNKFFRSEDFRTRENSGTGLGLYVTLKLVKLLNAKVDMESKVNEGSTFIVTVPDYSAQ